jgi:hypothetical protein
MSEVKDFFVTKFSRNGRRAFTDEVTDYEASFDYLCRTDQVVHFFEYEIDSYSPYVATALEEENIKDNEQLDKLRYEAHHHNNELVALAI